MEFLPYDPGKLPTAPEPKPGESIKIEVKGLPPYQDYHFSLRNPKHKNYSAFVELRKAATEAMKGRAWYHGFIRMFIDIKTPNREEMTGMLSYVGGIMDTLNGYSGPNFTYLPIVYEDDCQVYRSGWKIIETNDECAYAVYITFE
jgi:hypothetical protein